MIDTNELPVVHEDYAMYIRTALLWVASTQFINERPEEVAALRAGVHLREPPSAQPGGDAGAFPCRQDP